MYSILMMSCHFRGLGLVRLNALRDVEADIEEDLVLGVDPLDVEQGILASTGLPAYPRWVSSLAASEAAHTCWFNIPGMSARETGREQR